MYIPKHFQSPDPDATASLLANCGSCDLITATEEGLYSTFLPFFYEPAGSLEISTWANGALLGHVARGNAHWKKAVKGEALVIVHASDAYISPSWYPSKFPQGRVVPTWNYTIAHVYGQLVVHDEPEWVERVVRKLTNLQESIFEKPWSVDDAPEDYRRNQLRAIVGLEVQISRIEAKFKLSQNRDEGDIVGTANALENQGHEVISSQMREHLKPKAT